MKAAVFYGKNNLKIENIPTPEPDDNEVQIKVKACGICGTDVHIFCGHEGAAKTPSGTVLGHEFSGLVTKVGKNVNKVKVRDRVCINPNKPCNECYYCRNGLEHFCTNMRGIGTTENGGFSEYCVVPKSQVYLISEHTSYESAAMTEPVSCCLHGIDMCDISCSDTVMIIGGGMIGMIMLQLAKIKGAAKLLMCEPVDEKRKLAKKLGADLCINPFDQDISDVLKENDISRINTVIECVGSAKTMEQAIKYAGKKSTVMFFGLTEPDAFISIKPFEIFKKELTIKSSFINPYTQQRSVDLINSKKIDVSSMVNSICSLDDLPKILSDKDRRSIGKYIIKP